MRLQVTRPGGPWPVAFDGVHIVNVNDGEIHEFPSDMAAVWLANGWSKKLDQLKPEVVAAPENKMIVAAPEPVQIAVPEVPQAKEPEPPTARPHKRGRRR